jgi:DNA-binding NtrC family response regulator
MNLTRKTILIIDDDAATLRALSKILRNKGALVTGAGWAGEALEQLTAGLGHFDLIITDLRMPFLDGETILRAVMAALPQAHVIVITAFGSAQLKAECLRRGAAAFLEKPLDTPQLLHAVARALSLHVPECGRNASHLQSTSGLRGATSDGRSDPSRRKGRRQD